MPIGKVSHYLDCDLIDPCLVTLLTQNDNLLCGTYYNADHRDTCLTFTNGSWNVGHNLICNRYDHESWKTDSGVLTHWLVVLTLVMFVVLAVVAPQQS